MGGAAWQYVGRGRGARMGLRESIQVGAEVPRGNLWAGMAVPEVLEMKKERQSEKQLKAAK